MKPWDAKKIRYIKLGDGGKWWNECKERKILRLGFNSGSADIFEIARNGHWELVKTYWAEHQVGTPTQHANQMQEFFEDDGQTLWITFEGGCLYYAFTDGGEIIKEPPSDSTHWTSHRKLTQDGWRNIDVDGNELRREGLSGRLTKTAGYRQTICGLQKDVEDYLRNRLKCKLSPDLVNALKSVTNLEKSIQPLVKVLTPSDFELLVELIFSNSGWRKNSPTGGNQKTTDLDLYNPITNKQIWVQVKSTTNPNQFSEYVEKHFSDRTSFETMYYVYHSGNVGENLHNDSQISVWDIETVAKQVVANGLTDWVLNKAK
jgi:hypothetical protein